MTWDALKVARFSAMFEGIDLGGVRSNLDSGFACEQRPFELLKRVAAAP